VWWSAFGALLWALHPLRVEAVTWANSRIHEQALLFGLASLLCYLRAHDAGRSARAVRGWFGASVGLYFLSLLSYGTTLAYPVVLLVVDVVVLRRLDVDGRVRWRGEQARRVLVEKIPIVLAAGLYLGITLWAGAHAQGLFAKPVGLDEFGVAERMMQAFYIWGRFLWKPLDLWHLMPVYTVLVKFSPGDAVFLGSMVLVLAITAALVLLRRRAAGALGLWICHLAILVPVLGLTEHPHYPSDRYSYVQGILWSVLLAAGLWQLGRRVAPWARTAAAAVAGAALVVCAAATAMQQATWMNSETLFRHMLAELGDDPYRADIHRRLAGHYATKGRLDEALTEVDKALALVPRFLSAGQLKARILMRMGDDAAKAGQIATAGKDYVAAAELLLPVVDEDRTPMTQEMIGIAYTKANRLSHAETVFGEALRRFPGAAMLYLRQAQVVYLEGREAEGRELMRRAVEMDPSLKGAAERLAAYWSTRTATQTAPSTREQ
jgi:tetratricopeptide (TPR) repeat protein